MDIKTDCAVHKFFKQYLAEHMLWMSGILSTIKETRWSYLKSHRLNLFYLILNILKTQFRVPIVYQRFNVYAYYLFKSELVDNPVVMFLLYRISFSLYFIIFRVRIACVLLCEVWPKPFWTFMVELDVVVLFFYTKIKHSEILIFEMKLNI